MDLIIDEQGTDRLAILPKHIGKHVDVFCVGSGFQKTFYQLIKLQDVIHVHQARRARFYGNKSNRYRGRICRKIENNCWKRR